MLGEKIGEFTGKTTGVRVLSNNGNTPRLEVSIQQTGRICGVESTDMGTYVSEMQPQGFFKGEGQGVSMTKDGEMITWTANALGRPTGKGTAVNWRGSVFYTTASKNLSRLNGLCCVFEYDVDENGNSKGNVHEWR